MYSFGGRRAGAEATLTNLLADTAMCSGGSRRDNGTIEQHMFTLFVDIKSKNLFLPIFCYFLLLGPMNFLLSLFETGRSEVGKLPSRVAAW